jgi:thioredoxin reductase (NADPH)
VVGGGDAAVEESEFLTRYATKVWLIHRRHELRASNILQQRLFQNPKIEVVWDTVVERIEGNGKAVTHLALRNTTTGATSSLPVGGVFIFVGFRPNTGIVKGHVTHDAGGHIVANEQMMSSIPGLFVAGDVRAQLTRQVTTAVGDATTAVIAATRYLAERQGHREAGGAAHRHAD